MTRLPRRTAAALVSALASVVSVVAFAAASPASAQGSTPRGSTPPGSTPQADSSGDVLIPNYSFESGLQGWDVGDAGPPVPRSSPACDAAATVSTAEHKTGAAALRLQRADGCPEPGVLSAPAAITARDAYYGYVSVLLPGSSGAAMRIVFQGARHQVVGVTSWTSSASRHPAGWTTLSAHGSAPAGAATVAVEIRLKAGPGPVYADDALVTGRYTNLGAQISSASVNAVTYGADALGNPTAYAVVTGNDTHDAQLIGINDETGAVTANVDLPGATGAWAATTATDGSIYVGSYNYDNTAEGAHLYRYVPGAATATDLGSTIQGDTFVFSLAAGPGGAVFGGGYPSGGVFKYTPGSGFTQVGTRPLAPPEQYAHGVAYDSSNGVLYAGIGAHAHLMACPGAGSDCTDILPAQYQTDAFTYSVSAGDGYVFANMSPTGDGNGDLLILKVTVGTDGSVTATPVKDIPNVKYPGASGVIDGAVYYVTTSNNLGRYDIAANAATSTGISPPTGPRAWGVTTIGGDPVLLGTGNGPSGPVVVKYDTTDGTLTSVPAVDAPPVPTDIEDIQAGPDGNIYSSGFQSGAAGVYTPMRSDQSVQYGSGLSQAEGAAVIGDTLYWGTYPGADIYGYTTGQPWTPGRNPRVVCSLTAEDQDRPYGMVNAGGQLYIGTEASYGNLQGALTVYDPGTGTCTANENVIPDESVTSLAYLDGTVYGGTSIWGGLGVQPTQTEAGFFTVNTASGATTRVPLPVPGVQAVLGLSSGPDHRIWMVAETNRIHILAYDPASHRFTADIEPFPRLPISTTSPVDGHDAFLAVGGDGDLYGTVHSTYLYRLDPRTLRVTILRAANVQDLTTDQYGNVYYVEDGYQLWRMAVAAMTK